MQTRPFDVVAVETNWVLDVTLHQDEGSEELLTQAEHGVVQLFLPSICIAESIKRFESMRQSWVDLERGLKGAARESCGHHSSGSRKSRLQRPRRR